MRKLLPYTKQEHKENRLLIILTAITSIATYFHFNCNIWIAIFVFSLPFIFGLGWMMQNKADGLPADYNM